MRLFRIAALLLLCPPAFGAPASKKRLREEAEGPKRALLSVRYKRWFTSGGTSFRNQIQIPQAQVTPPGDVYLGTTQEMRSSPQLDMYSVELRPWKLLSFDFQYGTGTFKKGRAVVHSWIHAPNADVTNLANGYTWHSPEHEDFQRFEGQVDGRTNLASANIYLRVMQGRYSDLGDGFGHGLDVVLGYTRLEENYHINNGELTYSPGTLFPPDPLGPFAGLDSSYRAVWQAPHFGLREEVNAPGGFSFYGFGTFTPIAVYRGYGFDNLSADANVGRRQSPNYTHVADGSAFEMNLAVAWSPVAIWSLEAGYAYYYYFSRRGTQREYYADGTHDDIRLDYARTTRRGAFLATSLRF